MAPTSLETFGFDPNLGGLFLPEKIERKVAQNRQDWDLPQAR